MPAESAASKLRSPAQRDRDQRRAQAHHAKKLTTQALENAETLSTARDLRRESWVDKTRNRQDETILSSEQERRELRACVRREVVARNGDVADATQAAQTLHIKASSEEGLEFNGATSLRNTR